MNNKLGVPVMFVLGVPVMFVLGVPVIIKPNFNDVCMFVCSYIIIIYYYSKRSAMQGRQLY